MPRSAVLTGRNDARDRARLRHRLDRRSAPQSDPHADIEQLLAQMFPGGEPPDAGPVDLDRYLQASGQAHLPPEERLRQLAMHLETDLVCLRPAELDRIYEAAVRLQPSAVSVWHSRGISAKLAAEVTDDPKVISKYSELSLRCLTTAADQLPSDPDITYSLGAWHYQFGQLVEALEHFDKAIRESPGHGLARLYRAHCLHDLERWTDAVAAYADVPLDALKGPSAWRVDVVLEAQAYCKLRAGDRQGAIADFERLLDRLDKEPRRGLPLMLQYLREAVSGDLAPELGEHYRRVARALDEA